MLSPAAGDAFASLFVSPMASLVKLEPKPLTLNPKPLNPKPLNPKPPNLKPFASRAQKAGLCPSLGLPEPGLKPVFLKQPGFQAYPAENQFSGTKPRLPISSASKTRNKPEARTNSFETCTNPSWKTGFLIALQKDIFLFENRVFKHYLL